MLTWRRDGPRRANRLRPAASGAPSTWSGTAFEAQLVGRAPGAWRGCPALDETEQAALAHELWRPARLFLAAKFQPPGLEGWKACTQARTDAGDRKCADAAAGNRSLRCLACEMLLEALTQITRPLADGGIASGLGLEADFLPLKYRDPLDPFRLGSRSQPC